MLWISTRGAQRTQCPSNRPTDRPTSHPHPIKYCVCVVSCGNPPKKQTAGNITVYASNGHSCRWSSTMGMTKLFHKIFCKRFICPSYLISSSYTFECHPHDQPITTLYCCPPDNCRHGHLWPLTHLRSTYLCAVDYRYNGHLWHSFWICHRLLFLLMVFLICKCLELKLTLTDQILKVSITLSLSNPPTITRSC